MAGTQQDSVRAAAGHGPAPDISQRRRRPPSGRLCQALGLLFPEAPLPAPRPRGQRLLMAFGYAALAGLGAAVLLLRQAGRPAWRTFWAEDHSVFLPRALSHPWASLFQEQAGYLQLVPQLIADAVARLPAGLAAAGFAVAGALVASCCAIFVGHASHGHIRQPGLRVLLACSVLLLPTAVIEIANSGVDSPWYLMYALFWALLWRPRSRPALAVAALIAFATMASNILNLLYLPLVAARVLALPRAREQAVTFGWAGGIVFQVPGILESREPHQIGSVPAAFHFYAQHVLVAAVAGWPAALHAQAAVGVPGCIAIAASVIAAAVGWVAWHADARIRMLTGTALAMGLILTVVPALIRVWVPLAASNDLWLPGSRYTASAILLIDGIVIAGVDAFLRRGDGPAGHTARHAAVVLLIAALSIGWLTSFRYPNLRS